MGEELLRHKEIRDDEMMQSEKRSEVPVSENYRRVVFLFGDATYLEAL